MAEPLFRSNAAAAPRLGIVDLIALGGSAVIGAGVFVITGTAAARYAGPAIALSFGLAACLCGLIGACFLRCMEAEPELAGAPAHIRAGFGDHAGWLAGWALVAEFGFALAAVAVGWSGYARPMLAAIGLPLSPRLLGGSSAGLINLPAMLIILVLGAVALGGLRQSARILTAMVAVKLAIIVIVLATAMPFIQRSLLTPFLPPNAGRFGAFGWSGVLRGTIVVFSAFLGFDVIAAAAPSARRPRRDMAVALAVVLAVAAALYAATAIVMTGIVPLRALDVADPLAQIVPATGGALDRLAPWIAIGALVGLTSVMLSILVALPRMLASLARSVGATGLLSSDRGATIPVALGGAALAGLAPVGRLAELIAIAALLLFAGIAARAFQLGRGTLSLTCLVATIGLLASAPLSSLGWFAAWMAGGSLVGLFAGKGRTHGHSTNGVGPMDERRGGLWRRRLSVGSDSTRCDAGRGPADG